MKARFSHVMNDDITGITFLYFDGGTIQALNDRDVDHDYLAEFCVHMDSQDHRKLEAALRKEPYDCTVFNEKEMKLIKDLVDNCLPDTKPDFMTQAEFEDFCEKIN